MILLSRCCGIAILAFAISFAQVSLAAEPDYWPQWRGPQANGFAPSADPPITWSETQNVKWKVALPGSGASTPIVWQNKIFIQTAIETAADRASMPAPSSGTRGLATRGLPPPTQPVQFVVLCIDRGTGKTLWQKAARELVPHEGTHQDHGFASYSPITDGKNLYVSFGSRGLFCYDLDGNVKWEQKLPALQMKSSFGEASSPALFGDKLVVLCDQEKDSFIAAYDKSTGKELWRTPRDEISSWTTPLVVTHEGKQQVVTAATKKVRSYDLESGKLLWECTGLTANSIPSPVVKDGVVYVTTGYQGAMMMAIKLGRTGDLTGGDAITWKVTKNTPYVASPLLYGDRLYYFGSFNAILTSCDTATGKTLIDAARISDLQGVYASAVGAAGRVYLAGRNGATVVIKHSDKLEPLATNKLDDAFDASPALVDKEMFLRGRQNLYCIAAP